MRVQIRLAEPLIALSGIGDLGRERKTGAAARSCFIACRLARAMGLPDPDVQDVFYTALLQHVGCVGYAQETAAIFSGRDIEMNRVGSLTDFADPADFFNTFIPELTAGTDILTKIRLIAAALTQAPKLGPTIHRASCEIASVTAQRIGLGPGVVVALRNVEEWYDGKGGYQGVSGTDIPVVARIVLTAMTAMTFHELGGADAAQRVVTQRAGKQLDPATAVAFAVHGREILNALDAADVESELVAEEPEPFVHVDDDRLDEIALAFGQIVDLKTPAAYGTSRSAFDLADRAATVMGFDRREVGRIRRAAALRDIGKAAVSNRVLAKPAALNRSEEDEYELHALHTQRVLARATDLSAEAELASVHHEREDGSGYFRGLRGESIAQGGKLIAAVDAYLEGTHPRVGEPLPPQAACQQLQQLAGRGALDSEATRAVVVAVTGAEVPVRRDWPAALTERQVEVLRHIARGLSNKQIAAALVVSPRTAEHHVQDIYQKIGVSSRAAATLFAMQHRLL
ncbi:HD domain-containing protein [Arthrobacter alkaliphilus]